MLIYAEKPRFKGDKKPRRPKIFGTGVSIEKGLPRKIDDVLKISAESDEGINLSNLIIKLAKIKIIAPAGFSFLAFVVERRYVEVYCIFKKTRMPKLRVLRLDGHIETPNLLKITVIESIIASVKEMQLTPLTEQGFVARLEKMKETKFY